mmetsp:Transcript_43381/g.131971  ORF Transcript_43381/g.131971 Transcript_43381/m.131971 type:complete len:266 (+) Transcript_43381:844-1641(+)
MRHLRQRPGVERLRWNLRTVDRTGGRQRPSDLAGRVGGGGCIVPSGDGEETRHVLGNGIGRKGKGREVVAQPSAALAVRVQSRGGGVRPGGSEWTGRGIVHEHGVRHVEGTPTERGGEGDRRVSERRERWRTFEPLGRGGERGGRAASPGRRLWYRRGRGIRRRGDTVVLARGAVDHGKARVAPRREDAGPVLSEAAGRAGEGREGGGDARGRSPWGETESSGLWEVLEGRCEPAMTTFIICSSVQALLISMRSRSTAIPLLPGW